MEIFINLHFNNYQPIDNTATSAETMKPFCRLKLEKTPSVALQQCIVVNISNEGGDNAVAGWLIRAVRDPADLPSPTPRRWATPTTSCQSPGFLKRHACDLSEKTFNPCHPVRQPPRSTPPPIGSLRQQGAPVSVSQHFVQQ